MESDEEGAYRLFGMFGDSKTVNARIAQTTPVVLESIFERREF